MLVALEVVLEDALGVALSFVARGGSTRAVVRRVAERVTTGMMRVRRAVMVQMRGCAVKGGWWWSRSKRGDERLPRNSDTIRCSAYGPILADPGPVISYKDCDAAIG